jgi:hypothetical protein
MAKGMKTGGRTKGTPNKISKTLKEAILDAAELAGGQEGVTGYLRTQAMTNPTAFMSLLGKVLPTQIANEEGAAFQVAVTRIETVVVDPKA